MRWPNRKRARVIGLIVALWLGSATVSAQVVTVPPDLIPRAQYRLVFVTSAKQFPDSSTIADYNSFVTIRRTKTMLSPH